ncbi:MAG TPA: GH1 family beta-glucosidase [Candidatus Nanopelagicales bacterium]|nr:GH1 family beta-glucosidase [Candidatus Nanopelagicales bacterium]
MVMMEGRAKMNDEASNDEASNDDANAILDLDIPPNFEMGVATSAWQIEGDLAGRGRCTWDDFAAIPGKIVDGASGEPACDHVHRLSEDLDLLSWLGVDAYRFSFSWPRIIPGGRGTASEAGLDFYDQLIDGLLERGIAPVATLFHWDTPSELEDAGGWTNRATAQAFADYASVVGERYADRVERWATLNEPWCASFLGYAAGYFAPGRTEPEAAFAAAYHLMLGHGLAVQRLREHEARNVGIVLNVIPTMTDDPAMAAATQHINGIQNRLWLDLLAGRGIPEDLKRGCADLTDWSFMQEGDLPIIASYIDWVGENYYSVNRVVSVQDAGPSAIGQDAAMFPGAPVHAFAPRPPFTDIGWEILPEGIGLALKQVSDALPGLPIFICENGAAVEEKADDDGIHDPIRTQYLHDHIQQVLLARESGIDVRGYYAWSLMDNLEWSSGWTKKFGIISVDPETGTRTIKDSARWYRVQLARRK